jgi:hypothetical protein
MVQHFWKIASDRGRYQRFREIGVVGREGLREILEETELGTDLGEGFTG